MAAETKVFIQAASDAWMGARANVTAISVSNSHGATQYVPLIQTSNGLCIPDGTSIVMADTLEPNINGNSYQASKTQLSGGTSFFNGSDFYLRDVNGDPLSTIQNTRAAGGEVQWFFSDDDPRKMYGLPYHYVSHKGTHQAGWTSSIQEGRSRKYVIDRGDAGDPALKQQIFNYRTRWDFIAPAISNATGGGKIPGYGFGDKSNLFKNEGTVVTKCEAVSSGLAYGAIITTNQSHFAEAGDLFTTRDFNSSKVASLVVDIGGENPVSTIPDVDSVFQVYSVLDNLRFTTHELANQNSKTHLKFTCNTTGTATTGTGRGAKVVFAGKSTHADDYFQRPARMPTTTRFQLNVTDISHTFNDMVSITPMMKTKWDGTLHEQIQTLGYSVGMRRENMKFSGTLVDRGPISATNPRKQVLMNICRTQWLKISGLWGGKDVSSTNGFQQESPSGTTEFKGLGYGGPVNPRSYPCITIYDPANQSSSNNRLVDLNPDGGYNIYRGIIKSLSFTQVGGRPDIWDWTMDFTVMSNEKPASGTLDYEDPSE
jgi:hypothetical protein